MLGKLGAVIAGALNGQEAIDLLKENKFDVVLMDLNMPVMDGFQATRAIRSMVDSHNQRASCDVENLEQPFIVALTAYSALAFKEKCY